MVLGSIGLLDPKLLNRFYFLVITRKRNSHGVLHLDGLTGDKELMIICLGFKAHNIDLGLAPFA